MMNKRKLLKKLAMMLIGTALLTACSGQAAQVVEAALEEIPIEAVMEAEPPASDQSDDGYTDAIEPSIPHEIAMRAKLDEAIMERFGYDEIRVSRSIENNYFDIKYILRDVPSESDFYSEMEALFQEVFDFYLFEDHDNLDDWYAWNDEDPQEMSAAFSFDDMNYYWIVELHGNELIFAYI